ncbi:MAG TPA: hypothetical protein VGD67_11635, partial [Pseudonocardiaceae bacterium]
GHGAQREDLTIRSFDRLGGEMALGMMDLVGGNMFTLTGEQEREITGRPAPAAGGGGTGTGSGSGGASGAHHDGADAEHIDTDRLDLDELAVRLYDRLRSRLRSELLVDRERAGLLSDFR